MGLEAVMICIDNSEYSRNGDYAPSRFDQQTETANLLGGTKTGRTTSWGLHSISRPRRPICSAGPRLTGVLPLHIFSWRVHGSSTCCAGGRCGGDTCTPREHLIFVVDAPRRSSAGSGRFSNSRMKT